MVVSARDDDDDAAAGHTPESHPAPKARDMLGREAAEAAASTCREWMWPVVWVVVAVAVVVVAAGSRSPSRVPVVLDGCRT